MKRKKNDKSAKAWAEEKYGVDDLNVSAFRVAAALKGEDSIRGDVEERIRAEATLSQLPRPEAQYEALKKVVAEKVRAKPDMPGTMLRQLVAPHLVERLVRDA